MLSDRLVKAMNEQNETFARKLENERREAQLREEVMERRVSNLATELAACEARLRTMSEEAKSHKRTLLDMKTANDREIRKVREECAAAIEAADRKRAESSASVRAPLVAEIKTLQAEIRLLRERAVPITPREMSAGTNPQSSDGIVGCTESAPDAALAAPGNRLRRKNLPIFPINKPIDLTGVQKRIDNAKPQTGKTTSKAQIKRPVTAPHSSVASALGDQTSSPAAPAADPSSN